MLNKTVIRDTLNQVGRYLTGEPEPNRRWQMGQEQIRVSVPKGKPFVDDLNKAQPDKKDEPVVPVVIIKQEAAAEKASISLQDAVIWSEILGKPMCKRRMERNRLR